MNAPDKNGVHGIFIFFEENHGFIHLIGVNQNTKVGKFMNVGQGLYYSERPRSMIKKLLAN